MKLDSLIKRPDLPTWFTILNYIALLPVVLWPFTFFLSFFLFDAPNPPTENYIYFFVFIGYPIILFLSMLLSFWLYKRQKHIAIILPSLFLLFYCYLLYDILAASTLF